MFQKKTYQKMRREQGYNISKIQTGVACFDGVSVCDIEKLMPKLDLIFFKFDPFARECICIRSPAYESPP